MSTMTPQAPPMLTAVGNGTYEVWRDGQALIAAWTDVPLGQ